MLLESANRMDFKNALEIVFLKGVKYCLYAMGCTGVVQIIAYLLIIIGHQKQGRTNLVLPLNYCYFLKWPFGKLSLFDHNFDHSFYI